MNQKIFQIMHYFKLMQEKLKSSNQDTHDNKWLDDIKKIFDDNCISLSELITELESKVNVEKVEKIKK